MAEIEDVEATPDFVLAARRARRTRLRALAAVCAGLCCLAGGTSRAATGSAESDADPAVAGTPIGASFAQWRTARTVAIEGCRSIPESELLRLRVSLAQHDGTDIWTAPGRDAKPRALPLWALGRTRDGGALLDDRAVQAIAEGILDAYARADRMGAWVEVPDAAASDTEGVLLLRVHEAESPTPLERVTRGEGAPARIARIEFKGLSGSWLSESELRALPLRLARVPEGYIATREDLPTVQHAIADLERPEDSPIALYPSALQALLDAVSDAYRERGAPGVRVHIDRSALRRTLGATSTGLLEVQVGEP